MKKTFKLVAIQSALISALSIAGMTGCSKNTDVPASSPQPAKPSIADAQNPVALAKAAEDNLPKGDVTTPISNYRKIDSGNQLMFLYFGLLNLPIDYDQIAQTYSAEYAQTTDSFKRKDIVTALMPRIDQEITKAKSSRYVMMDDVGSNLLNKYDFAKKAFVIPALTQINSYNYFNDNSKYQFTRTNAEKFSSLSVPDEAAARVIEGYLSKYANLKLEIYGFAQDADPSNHRIKVQILKIRLLSPTGEMLVER